MPSVEAVSLYPSIAAPAAESHLTIRCASTVEDLDERAWDELVPRDMPHLRCGFLKAVEASGFGRQPQYYCAWRGTRLQGVAVAYIMPVDLLTLAPPKYTRWINALRNALAARILFLQTL